MVLARRGLVIASLACLAIVRLLLEPDTRGAHQLAVLEAPSRPEPAHVEQLPEEVPAHVSYRPGSIDLTVFGMLTNKSWRLEAPISPSAEKALTNPRLGAVAQMMIRQGLERKAAQKLLNSTKFGGGPIKMFERQLAQQRQIREKMRSAAFGSLDTPLSTNAVFRWLEAMAVQADLAAEQASKGRSGDVCLGRFVVGKRKDFDTTARGALRDAGMCEAGPGDEPDFYLGEEPQQGAVVKAPRSAAIGWIPGIREAAGTKNSFARLRVDCWNRVASPLCDFTSPGFNFARKGPGQPVGQYNSDREASVGAFRELAQKISQDELKHNPFPQLWVLKRQKAYAQFGMKMLRLDEADVQSEMRTAQWLQRSMPNEAGAWTVQEYVRRPATFKGRKFDVRAWALLTGLDPLRLTLKRGFFPKVSTKLYNASARHQHDLCMHLQIPSGPECNTKRHPKPYPRTTASSYFYSHVKYARAVPLGETWENVVVPQVERILSFVMLLARQQALRDDAALTAAGALYRRFLVLSPDFIVDAEGRVTMIELNTNGNLLSGVGSRVFKTRGDVESMLHVLGAAGYPRAEAVERSTAALWKAFCGGAPLSGEHGPNVTCTPALADAVARLQNEEMAALNTPWYRVFPALFSESHEPLVLAVPSELVTPLDRSLHAYLRFRKSFLERQARAPRAS